MTDKELNNIALDAAEELRELPDGTIITSGRFLEEAGYNPDEMEIPDLFSYDKAFRAAAKKIRVRLEAPKTDRMINGFPWGLPYVVHNEKAQIRCPRCGSTDTARILYGMPAMTHDLKAKLDAGRIRLGGCLLTEVRIEGYGTVSLDPEMYCSHCRRTFSGTAVYREKGQPRLCIPNVRSVHLQIWNYLPDYAEDILLTRNEEGAVVLNKSPRDFRTSEYGKEKQISEKKWKNFLEKLFYDCYLTDWKKHTLPPEGLMYMDGESWTLEVRFRNGRKRTWSGQNAYPPYWKELHTLLRSLVK